MVRALSTRDVSAVPVVAHDGRVLGVVSEADLMIKQGTQELDFLPLAAVLVARPAEPAAPTRPQPPS